MKLLKLITLLYCMLFINGKANSALIELGYSGTIDTSFADFEPGSVVSVWLSYESASAFDVIDGKILFPAFDIVLNMNGQSVTNDFGYLRVFAGRLELRTGAGIANGRGSPFSDSLAGIEVR